MAEEEIDLASWLDDEQPITYHTRKQKKRCPDCFGWFTSEFELFNHRISECTPNRSISIVKISKTQSKLRPKSVNIGSNTTTILPTKGDDSDFLLKRIKILRCRGCGAKFKTSWNLKRHKQSCKPFRELAKTVPAEELTENEFIKVLAPKHRCNDCGMVFNRLFNLKRHVKNSSCKKGQVFRPHACSTCKKMLVSKESLRNHKLRTCPILKGKPIVSIKPQRLLTCKGCGTNFTKTYNLNRHQSRTCPALKVLSKDSVCYVCSLTFPSFDSLKEHLEKCHTDD